ncbi:hypothetical protein MBLNU230_g6669t1 [Neophaeotheca triangularis]
MKSAASSSLVASLTFASLFLAPLSQAKTESRQVAWRRAWDKVTDVPRSLGLTRRQDDSSSDNSDTDSIPAPLSIGPSQYWDGNDGPWSSFPIQAGSPAQNQRVFISSAATQVITIQADGCEAGYVENCEDDRGFLFLTNESLTWVENSRYRAGISMSLDMDTSGDAGFDTVTLGWQGSNAEPSTEHTNMLSIADSTYWLGLFGLNPRPTNYTSFRDPQPSFLETLKTNNSIPSVSWGYTAGAKYRLDEVFGSLTLGGYDENRFTRSNISWPFYSDISRDMLVNLQSITTDEGSPSDLLPDGPISVFLDSTLPYIWLPKSACSAFEEAFGISWDNESQHYLLNSSTHSSLTDLNPSVTFSLGTSPDSDETVDIVLPYAAFDLNVSFPIVAESSHYFPLKRAENETQYTLGRTFFQEAYVIYDYERQNFTVQPCKWDQSTLRSTSIQPILSPDHEPPSSSDSSDSSLSTGAIAGIVVGAVVGLTLLAAALFLYLRRRRRQQTANQRPTTSSTSPSSASSFSQEGKPHISSAAMGTELPSSSEIHELSGPQKLHPQEMESPYKLEDPSRAGYVEAPGAGDPGHGKGGAHEVGAGQHGEGQVFELPGSEVRELEGSGVHSGVFGGISGK